MLRVIGKARLVRQNVAQTDLGATAQPPAAEGEGVAIQIVPESINPPAVSDVIEQQPDKAAEREAIHKIVHLNGSLRLITELAQRRLEDPKCQQSPRQPFTAIYNVRVRYEVLQDGEIDISTVEVAFERDRWTCFFDIWDGKCGVVHHEHDRDAKSYYLPGADDIVAVIRRYEDRQIIRRLARQGPKAFPRTKKAAGE